MTNSRKNPLETEVCWTCPTLKCWNGKINETLNIVSVMFAAFYLDVTKYAIVERTRQVRDTFKTETFIHTITSFMVTAHVAGLAQCLLRYIANSENFVFSLRTIPVFCDISGWISRPRQYNMYLPSEIDIFVLLSKWLRSETVVTWKPIVVRQRFCQLKLWKDAFHGCQAMYIVDQLISQVRFCPMNHHPQFKYK